jgi:hypothetical protein
VVWGIGRIPISRWYVRSIVIGCVLAVLAYFLLIFPLGNWDAVEPFFLAIRLVDENGHPVVGRGVYEGGYMGPPIDDIDLLGQSDPNGYVFVVRQLMYGSTFSLLWSHGAQKPSGRFSIWIRQGTGLQQLGVARALRIPPEVKRSYPPWTHHNRYQLNSLPPWASAVEVFHATIEP